MSKPASHKTLNEKTTKQQRVTTTKKQSTKERNNKAPQKKDGEDRKKTMKIKYKQTKNNILNLKKREHEHQNKKGLSSQTQKKVCRKQEADQSNIG